jgi:hypothetical protein
VGPLDLPAIPQCTDHFHIYPGSFRHSRDQSPWFTFGYERAEIGPGRTQIRLPSKRPRQPNA